MLHKLFTGAVTRLALAGLLALGAIGGPFVATPTVEAHAARIHTVNIAAHDNGSATAFAGSFSMPTSVPTGLVEFHFTNLGSQDHMAQFFKLNSGVSESLFLKRLANVTGTPAQTVSGLHALLAIASAAGGPDSIAPGAWQNVIERLSAGHYVVVCLDSTPSGVPHFLLGMHRSFWASSSAKAPVDTDERVVNGLPAANSTIFEYDHVITIPHVLNSHGPLLLKISVRSQSHEFQLVRVPAGTTAAELQQCFLGGACPLTGPPIDSGGASAIAPGSIHWVELNLAPGTYAAVCFVPDIKTGMPHALMGMITVFTVS